MIHNQEITEIAFILDRSGSMQSLGEAAIAGFNQFLRDQQEAPDPARLTLVLFDDQYEVPVDNVPVSEILPLDTVTYVPRGSTALLDAIGRTIESFHTRIAPLPKHDRPGQVVFAIFTDGLENSSQHFAWSDIARLIHDRREADGWEFLFLGANQDAIATASQLNIHAHDAANVQCSPDGLDSSSRALSRKLQALRQAKRQHGATYRQCAAKAPDDLGDLGKSMEQLLREEERRE